MKRIFMLALAMLIIGCSGEFDQRFSYTPKFPKANQQITIRYNPKGTELETAQQIEMLVYEFSTDEITVSNVLMDSKGQGKIAEFTSDSSTLLLVIQFQAENSVDRSTHQILLYGDDGKYLPGALAVLSSIHFKGGPPLYLKRDIQLATTTLQQEFGLHPDQKEKYQELYWNIILVTDKEKGKERVTAKLDSIAAKDNLTLEDKKLLAAWYSRLEYKKNAEVYKKEIRQLEPRGHLVQSERFFEFQKTNDLEKKLNLYQQFKQDFSESEYLPNMTSILLDDFINSKRFDEARHFLKNDVVEPTAYDYNKLAWNMVEKSVDLETALKLSEKSVELARADLNLPISEKPQYLTDKQWRRDLRQSLGSILDTYAFALYKLNRIAESVPYFKESVELTQQTHHEINERYAQSLLDVDDNFKAYKFLKSLLNEGRSSVKIIELFKQAYQAINFSTQGLDDTLLAIRKTELETIKSELKKHIVNQPAPEFTLKDLSGQSISLKDFKGKIVIIDFWATWCGPCIRSFPGMQKAIDKFKSDDSVKFLFINAWEKGDDIKRKVANFINENNYTFHVLLDSGNKVIVDYEVEGIPTKFVIDKNGNIRFKRIGFEGNDDGLVEELSLMIELVR